MFKWKRVSNIRKDSYREDKGVEPWVPLFEAEEEIGRLRGLLMKMYNTYNNDRNPMRADDIQTIYNEMDKE